MKTYEMVLTNTLKTCLLDRDDFIRFKSFNWCLNDHGYVVTDSSKPKRKMFGEPCKVRLHRLIMCVDPKNKKDIDHINGNKLDNRKSNLRICTRSENLRNKHYPAKKESDRLKGAYFRSATYKNPWFSSISINSKMTFLGSFKTEKKAHEAHMYAQNKIKKGVYENLKL